ncbi:hypothetical protein ACLHDG_06805 [Sulfurovum sp. CS9]|uniref:hypothetical protein n=1 Tax=Sulfurovum sp. CS9 TaxID=3391146 RepID=UPI0039E800A6
MNPDGLNKGKLVIALDLNSTTGIMTNATTIPWEGVDDTLTSSENKGGGVSLADIDGNGQLDLISYFITNLGNTNPNHAYYRIGWNLSLVGWKHQPTSWTRHRANTDVGNITRFGGMTIGDIDGSGRPDLIVASVMDTHPNQFRYAVAHNLSKEGNLVTQHMDENGTLVPGN